MNKSEKKHLIFASIVFVVAVILSLSILAYHYSWFKTTSESYVSINTQGQKLTTVISNNPLMEQAVTFPSTTYTPGQYVHFTDSFVVPASVGSACVYKLSVLVYDPAGQSAWSQDISCLTTGPYGAGKTITNNLAFTIPKLQSSVGQWSAVTTYYYTADGCNSCPRVAAQATEPSVNKLNVIAEQQTCTPIWQSGAWSACASGVQTRTVTDASSCGTSTGQPVATQSCTSGITATCYDGIKNQDESAIDCGGNICQACSINPPQALYYIVNGQCISLATSPYVGITSYNTLAECQVALAPPKVDYMLYVIIGVISLLLVTVIVLVVRKYRQ